jgi:hypothetical protein
MMFEPKDQFSANGDQSKTSSAPPRGKDMTQSSEDRARAKGDARNLTAAALAVGAAAALAGGAEAATLLQAPDGYSATGDIQGVNSVHVQADGSVQLVMETGETVTIAATDAVVVDGVVYLSDAALAQALPAAAAAGGAGAGGAVLGIVGAGGLAAAAGGGGGSSGPPAPTNTNPPVFTSGTSASADENTAGTVYTATSTDADGNTVSYSIVGGADASAFTINASTGALRFTNPPDFETPTDSGGDNGYEVTIRASDGVNTTDQTVTITVDDVDEAPTFSSGSAATVAENQTSAYTAAATDPEGATVTYTLSGTDAALFNIDASTGVVTFKAAPDFEAPGDADSDNVYDITVTASDGTNTTDQAVSVTVSNVNEFAPVFTSATAVSVDENSTVAYTAVATDLDADATITYSLRTSNGEFHDHDDDNDSALFKIDATTGVVTFNDPPDFEAPVSNSLTIFVIASDGTNQVEQEVTITITDVNEAPVFTSAATASVAENITTAYTAVAADPDLTSPTYSIVGGADAALFTIDGTTGVVSFIAAPDFEAPGDANGDNDFEIIVRASDGTNDVDQSVTITVTDQNDNSPVFSSGATASIVEGTITAYDANATDGDAGDTLTYSLSGTDAALFSIDASTGVVSFLAAPDFEAPADANSDNIYDVTVTASDGTNSTNQAVTITVTDGNENSPAFTSATTGTVAENATAAYTATATDPDGDTVTFSIAGGADAALFAIDTNTGALTFITAPDFEAPGDGDTNNVYEVTIRATDGVNNTDQTVNITVTDENDNSPVFTSGATASVAENQTSAYDADATDADAGTSLTYSLSGTDAALFNINATTGVVTFISAPDFETPADAGGDNDYDFTVTASDGTNSTNQAVTVTVTDIGESNDVPADQSTPISLALGGTYDGELEVVGDRDWIRVELTAGQRYAISLTGSGGSSLSDPLVRLYDASGNLVAENDDGGPGLNSLLTYTVTATGTYYVEAAAWNDSVAGTYTVGLETAAPLAEFTNDQIAEFLETTYWTGNGTVARRWDAGEGDTITVNLTALTVAGQVLARAALALWSDVTGITFSEIATSAQMTFDDDEDGAFASVSRLGAFITSANINVSTDWLTTYGTTLDTYSFQTYIHEIGHALGLGHAGPYNGSADYGVDAAYLNDSWQATVMSYFSQSENTFINASYAFVMTPQVADILAIQNMYGLATSIRDGDTTYGFNSTAGNAVYDATSFTRITSYTIIDTGGTDTMDYSGSGANQRLDLREEHFSNLQGGTGNVGIARGTVIENAIGGTGDDTLIGNAADNVLTGNNGDDTFYSSGGDDTVDGGTGNDTVIFSGASGDYTTSTDGSGNTVLTDNRAGSPDGTTTLISIENIQYGGTAASPLAAAVIEEKPPVMFDWARYQDGSDLPNDAVLSFFGASSAFGYTTLMPVDGGYLELVDEPQVTEVMPALVGYQSDVAAIPLPGVPVQRAISTKKVEDVPVMEGIEVTDQPDVMDVLDGFGKSAPVAIPVNMAGIGIDLGGAGLSVSTDGSGFQTLSEDEDAGGFQIDPAVPVMEALSFKPGEVSDVLTIEPPVPGMDAAGFSVLEDDAVVPVQIALSQKGGAVDIPVHADLEDQPDTVLTLDTPEGW